MRNTRWRSEHFGPYLEGASEIVITDPYIRVFFQARNMMELLETLVRVKETGEDVTIHLVTSRDESESSRQEEYLQQMQTSAATVDIHVTWEFDDSGGLHARHIVTDTGWKILLDRGLDVFQRYDDERCLCPREPVAGIACGEGV